MHDLAFLIRTSGLLAAQGWRGQGDADVLRHDPDFRLATSSAVGQPPLEDSGLESHLTLSRFTAIAAEPANLKVLREAMLEMAGRGIRANGCRPSRSTSTAPPSRSTAPSRKRSGTAITTPGSTTR